MRILFFFSFFLLSLDSFILFESGKDFIFFTLVVVRRRRRISSLLFLIKLIEFLCNFYVKKN